MNEYDTNLMLTVQDKYFNPKTKEKHVQCADTKNKN